MAEAVHVSGEARIKIGSGSVGALEILGVSEDGVDINIEDHVDPVMTDTFGPRVPFDEQHFLETGTIQMRLIFYDEAILAKIRRPLLNSAAEGTMVEAGTLYGAAGHYFRLLILSPQDSLPWNFLSARMERAKRVKIGTKRNAWDLSFFAIPYTGFAGTSVGGLLYNRVTT